MVPVVGTLRDDDTVAAFEASPEPSPPQDPPLPATVGRFQILGRLGAGGMGEVFTAYDDRLDRKVAVKVVHRSGVGTKAQSRMLREAQALAKVSHPNVVAVHEVGEHRGDLYIAMELIRGETLREWATDARPWKDVVEVYTQAAAGLSAAHEVGLVHRDFKPDNAILGEDGRVRVLDFGLARHAHAADVQDATDLASTDEAHDDRLTQTGVTAGTPAYMAPEQMRHQPLSPATDQFSLCVALYEALYQERPFEGETQLTLFANVLEGTVRAPPPSSTVPPFLREALLRGLKVDPQDRFPSVRALASALANDPTRRRRKRLLVGAAFVAVTGGVYGGFSWGRALSTTQCPSGAEKIADVWSPDRADALAAHFSDEAPYVAHTWRSVKARADRYATTWASHWDSQCEAAVEDEKTPATARGTMCLTRTLDQFETSLELAASSTPTEWATAFVTEPLAQDPRDCLDPAGWEVDAVPSPDEERLAAELSRLRMHTLLGNRTHGLEQLPPLLERIRELDAPRVLVDALLTRAELSFHVGRFQDAREAVDEAILIAEPNRYDVGAARGLTLQLAIHFRGEHDQDAARALLPRAEAAVVRAGNPESLRVALLNQQVFLALMSGDDDQARTSARDAVDLVTQRYGDDDVRVVHALQVQSQAHMRTGDVETMRANEARVLEIFEREGGPAHPRVAEPLDNLGHWAYATDRWDEGLKTYQRAQAILEQPETKPNLQLAWVLAKLAEGHLILGDVDAALDRTDRSIALHVELESADSMHLSGPLAIAARAERVLGREAEAMEKLVRASELFLARDGARNSVHTFAEAMRAAADASLPLDAAPLHRYLGALHPSMGAARRMGLAAEARLLAARGESNEARRALSAFDAIQSSDTVPPDVALDVSIAHRTLGDTEAAARWWSTVAEQLGSSDEIPREAWPVEFILRVGAAEHAPDNVDPAQVSKLVSPAIRTLEDCCRDSPWLDRARRVLPPRND